MNFNEYIEEKIPNFVNILTNEEIDELKLAFNNYKIFELSKEYEDRKIKIKAILDYYIKNLREKYNIKEINNNLTLKIN